MTLMDWRSIKSDKLAVLVLLAGLLCVILSVYCLLWPGCWPCRAYFEFMSEQIDHFYLPVE